MNNVHQQNEAPKIIVVAESSSQRLAFSTALKVCGYVLIDCVPPNMVKTVSHKKVDLWLIDTPDDVQVLNQLKQDDQYLLGFTAAPLITDVKLFDKWQRHLKRKLTTVIGEVEHPTDPSDSVFIKRKSWEILLVLGASLGGLEALKQFLDQLPHDLAVSIVIAQHIDAQAIYRLPTILTKDNQWTCSVLEKKSQLTTGHVWLISPKEKSVFNASGWVLPTQESWQTQYKPSISETMISASEVFSSRVIHIIFSGMGDDGQSATNIAKTNKSEIWVQSADSCQCDSQPKAIIDTGHASFIGSPTDLADKVTQFVTHKIAKQNINSMT